MRGARPQASIEHLIKRGGALRRGECVVAACSGGADSVALVGALHALAKPMCLTLRVAHVNHGLRASAWQDECISLRIAATYELPIDVVALAPGPRDEQTLRTARYAGLIAAARQAGATALATAHHAEDQSETTLLALFRGAGPEGLAGMRMRRPVAAGIDLVRPLLRVPSEALLRYCHAQALPYAVDPTNADLGLRRNAVREALDALRPLFPGLDEAVARAAELVGDEAEGTRKAALRRRIRERLADEEALREVDFEHVEAAVRAIESGCGGTFHMKAGVRLEIRGGSIEGIKRE
ncbi:MAG: tRNA lysidine(34) synthetase TilS [Candidatus Eremiobacteraeota bacterium]|nr:tRNA lysidine(34) synthetase TilS [Candidatus Eremiobacteraeota bacterium]